MISKRLPANFAKVCIHGMLATSLAAFTLPVLTGSAMAVEPWPEGLREAVTSHFQALQVTEYRTRDSTLDNPIGVQPMTSFDRASHKCHEVPGQVYRIYKVPSHFSKEASGAFLLRSKFELFYRQADSIAKLFAQPWGQGSDGAVKVRFELVNGRWEAVEKREVLE